MKGKNGTTSFLPKKKKGGKVRFHEEVTYIPTREKMCLTKDQATQICEEVEKMDQLTFRFIVKVLKITVRSEKKASKRRRC